MLVLLSADFCSHYNLPAIIKISPNDIPHITSNDCRIAIYDHVEIICSDQEKENLIIENNNAFEITIISYEKFHELTQITHESVCDYIFYDSANSIFSCCELTSGMSKYLEKHLVDGQLEQGKRAKAYVQLETTTNKLLAVPSITAFVGQFRSLAALFAYRLSENVNQNSSIAKSINAFNRNPSSLNSSLGNGFYFVQRMYPNTFAV